jgi:hypothetical protein
MRGGLRGPALKNFTKAMFLFSKTWIDLQLTSLNVFTFSQLYSFLNSTLLTKNHFSNFLISNSGSVFLHEHSLGGNIISPKPNRSLKTLLLKVKDGYESQRHQRYFEISNRNPCAACHHVRRTDHL